MKYTIGHGSEIPPWKQNVTHSYHLLDLTNGNEIAIRYSFESIDEVGRDYDNPENHEIVIDKRPVFRQYV